MGELLDAIIPWIAIITFGGIGAFSAILALFAFADTSIDCLTLGVIAVIFGGIGYGTYLAVDEDWFKHQPPPVVSQERLDHLKALELEEHVLAGIPPEWCNE